MRPITERLSPAVKVLVIIQAFLFSLYALPPGDPLGPFFQRHLALGPGFWHGELWQPVTALFIHLDGLGFVFDLIGLWFVGAFIERNIGTRRFLQLFLVSGILAYVAMAGVSYFRSVGLGDGCSYAVLAVFVAFGKMYNRTPAQILGGLTLQARLLALVLFAWALVAELVRMNWGGVAAVLVASAVGFIVGGGGISDLIALARSRRVRRRYRVLDGGQSGRGRSGRLWN
jgi:membrane associated rhomboid family serine protease